MSANRSAAETSTNGASLVGLQQLAQEVFAQNRRPRGEDNLTVIQIGAGGVVAQLDRDAGGALIVTAVQKAGAVVRVSRHISRSPMEDEMRGATVGNDCKNRNCPDYAFKSDGFIPGSLVNVPFFFWEDGIDEASGLALATNHLLRLNRGHPERDGLSAYAFGLDSFWGEFSGHTLPRFLYSALRVAYAGRIQSGRAAA